MKIIKGDMMKSDIPIVVYLSRGKVAQKLKEEHPAIYSWVFPRKSLPLGSMIKTGATPHQGHVIFFAEDEYGGIKAGDLYSCFKAFKDYANFVDLDEDDIGITEELYLTIKNKDYIKE